MCIRDSYEAIDCKTGYEAVINPAAKYDLAFLDVSMPTYEEKNINTGEDIAKLLISEMPECKIALLTMHSESLKVQSIIDEINPLGLVIKNDLGFESMILALQTILKGEKSVSYTHLDVYKRQKQRYS